jgi:hypothetical protein
MQIFKIYFPSFNYDAICRKLMRLHQKLTKRIKPKNIEGGKYTFFFEVKKRAYKLRYYMKRRRMGLSSSNFKSPKQLIHPSDSGEKNWFQTKTQNFRHWPLLSNR